MDKMDSHQSKNLHLQKRPAKGIFFYSGNNQMQRGGSYNPFPQITISLIFKQLLAGLYRLLAALKDRISGFTTNLFSGLNIPWFKIGMVALALFIVAKKDIHLSINLKAPFTSIADDEERTQAAQKGGSEEFGLGQPVNLEEGSEEIYRAAALNQLDDQKVTAYIARFSKVAVTEMEKFGIPASIKMAQGIIESWAGEHAAARQNHNHFGAVLAGRPYNSAWENWRAHSLLLSNDFNGIFDNGLSYKKWAKALQNKAYNKDKYYSKKLIGVIEKFQLYLLDEL